MFCKNCGKEISDEAVVCPSCGVNTNFTSRKKSVDFSPVTTGDYFGYLFLFGIPLIGLIILIFFSFGGTENINLRSFARAHLLWKLLFVVFSIMLLVFIGYFIFLNVPIIDIFNKRIFQ